MVSQEFKANRDKWVRKNLRSAHRFAELLMAFDRLSGADQVNIRHAAETICGDGAATEDQNDAAHYIAGKLYPQM